MLSDFTYADVSVNNTHNRHSIRRCNNNIYLFCDKGCGRSFPDTTAITFFDSINNRDISDYQDLLVVVSKPQALARV